MFHSSHLGGGHLGADPAPSPAEVAAPAALPVTVPAPTAKATSLITIGIIAVVTYLIISSFKNDKDPTGE